MRRKNNRYERGKEDAKKERKGGKEKRVVKEGKERREKELSGAGEWE